MSKQGQFSNEAITVTGLIVAGVSVVLGFLAIWGTASAVDHYAGTVKALAAVVIGSIIALGLLSFAVMCVLTVLSLSVDEPTEPTEPSVPVPTSIRTRTIDTE